MNKLIIAGLFFAGIAITSAQETKPSEKETVRKTSNPIQKVGNILNPDHKEHNGYKVKRKTKKGKKYVKKVNTKQHKVRVKTKNSGDLDKKVVEYPTTKKD